MEELLKYFPDLTATQAQQFAEMGPLYADWNEKINVISRRDIDKIYLHHILHSLSVAKFFTPKPQTKFIDLGCGGGFPSIPLAVMWPECEFHLIDRIGKKVKVAQEIASALKLSNTTFQHGDSAECKLKCDFVLSRAVMSLSDLIRSSQRLVLPKDQNRIPNGLICLKGGDLAQEIKDVKRPVLDIPLSDFFSEEYYKEKELLYIEL